MEVGIEALHVGRDRSIESADRGDSLLGLGGVGPGSRNSEIAVRLAVVIGGCVRRDAPDRAAEMLEPDVRKPFSLEAPDESIGGRRRDPGYVTGLEIVEGSMCIVAVRSRLLLAVRQRADLISQRSAESTQRRQARLCTRGSRFFFLWPCARYQLTTANDNTAALSLRRRRRRIRLGDWHQARDDLWIRRWVTSFVRRWNG